MNNERRESASFKVRCEQIGALDGKKKKKVFFGKKLQLRNKLSKLIRYNKNLKKLTTILYVLMYGGDTWHV